MAKKHVAFAPARQKQLRSRLRSSLGVRLCHHFEDWATSCHV